MQLALGNLAHFVAESPLRMKTFCDTACDTIRVSRRLFQRIYASEALQNNLRLCWLPED